MYDEVDEVQSSAELHILLNVIDHLISALAVAKLRRKILIYIDYLPANGLLVLFAVQIVRTTEFWPGNERYQSRLTESLVAFCAIVCSRTALANTRPRFQ